MENIGDKIFKLRKMRGLTQAQLGAKVNRNPHTIKDYEKGRVVPSIRAIKLLAEALEVPEKDLLSDEIPVARPNISLSDASEILGKIAQLNEKHRGIVLRQIDTFLKGQEIASRKKKAN